MISPPHTHTLFQNNARLEGTSGTNVDIVPRIFDRHRGEICLMQNFGFGENLVTFIVMFDLNSTLNLLCNNAISLPTFTLSLLLTLCGAASVPISPYEGALNSLDWVNESAPESPTLGLDHRWRASLNPTVTNAEVLLRNKRAEDLYATTYLELQAKCSHHGSATVGY